MATEQLSAMLSAAALHLNETVGGEVRIISELMETICCDI